MIDTSLRSIRRFAAFACIGALAACGSYAPNEEPAARRVASAPAPTGDWRPTPIQDGRGVPTGRRLVQPGDTLHAIASRHGVSVRRLIAFNRLHPPYPITVGQTLLIPASRLHTVRPGETLYGISRQYGIDVATLSDLNRIGPPYRLSIGQVLALPLVSTPLRPPARERAVRRAAIALPGAEPAADGSAARKRRFAPAASQADAGRIAALPQKAVALPEPPARSASTFAWPVRGALARRFGKQKDGGRSDGIVISAVRGAPVAAAENGVVAYAGDEVRGFGNLLLIRHADDWMSAYGHNDVLLVRRGDLVRRGQKIARVGATGSAAKPQLHFELRRGSEVRNPLNHLAVQPGVAGKN